MDELRAHRRLNVDFDASINSQGLRDYPCKVRDFCLGGALLSFDDPLKPLPPGLSLLERGTPVELRVMTRSPGFRDTYTFSATVARRDRQTLGVSFASPDPTALMALQSLANVSSAQQRLGARGEARKIKFDEAVVRAALAGMRDCVRQHVVDVPNLLLTRVQKPVIDLSMSASSNEESNRLRDAITTLRRYSADIQSGFLQQALKPLEDFGGWQPGGLLPGNGSASRLSLIDKNAFEDWLAVKVMVSRAEADCKAPLFELQIRFNEMFGAKMGVQNNPVGPAVFFHALGEPIQRLKLPKQVEQLLLQDIENLLLERLARLYPALNEVLVRNGIMPDLEVGKYAKVQQFGAPRAQSAAGEKPAVKPAEKPAEKPAMKTAEPAAVRPAPEAVPEQAPAMPAPAAAPPPPAAAAATGTETGKVAAQAVSSQQRAELSVRQFELQQKIARQAYSTVQKLLAARQAMTTHAEGSAVAAVAPPPAWPTEAVTGVLDKLQKVPVSVAPAAPLRERLQQALDPSGTADKVLPAEQANAADTVDQLFMAMLGTPLLRDDTKPLIRQLEVPFLKLLLADSAFLSTEQHPARQVLNSLASLGARGAMTTPAQQQTIGSVVENLVSGFDNDTSVFTEALAVLEKMLEQQRKVYQHNLQRVRQSSEGLHRVNAARRRVLQVLEGQLGGKRVPRAVLTLLDAGWRESLVNTLLRHGTDSDAWKENLGVVEQMVRGIDDPAHLDMKSLLGVIKRGLSAQTTGQIGRDAVVNDLREMFTALSTGRSDAVPSVEVPVGAVDTESHIQMVDAEGLGRWLRRVRELEIGEWIELEDDDAEEPQQARLAWVDNDHTQFVFVNLQGMKVLDLDADSLARAFRDERARRIDDPETPLVDRGLEAMVQKVYGQLSHRATHDELTGLFNRKEFEKRLQQHVLRVKEGDAPWSLCWLDLDQFKVINSTCGFEAGDALIKEVGKLIVGAAGSDAEVARLGGDEFAVLARNIGEEVRKRTVDRILRAIEEFRFSWQGKAYPVAASAGIVFIGAGGVPAESLMKAAEAACYAAKEGGRNRVHVYQEDDARLTRRDDIIKWVSRLNQAIEHDQLQLRCQRIEPVDPVSGLLPHYEILIAIEDENGEFIPPSSFMQAAERYNRMHAVDRWVIRNTLEWMHEHTAKMSGIGGFSINLSGQSLNDEKLTTYILQQVLDSEVAREKVTFEVTETAAIANLSDAVDFIRQMQAIGCKFSLDDFGSGLSSYSYLKNLPVDYVKIDGAFIRDMHRNTSDYMMVRSINEMAHFMGKRTIAEYVENDEILAKLREIGVDFAQGYGIEKPRPLSTL
ncbi:MAG: DUF1631 family protein [Pseudomonadota bacterium]